jgi:hypothetical protein
MKRSPVRSRVGAQADFFGFQGFFTLPAPFPTPHLNLHPSRPLPTPSYSSLPAPDSLQTPSRHPPLPLRPPFPSNSLLSLLASPHPTTISSYQPHLFLPALPTSNSSKLECAPPPSSDARRIFHSPSPCLFRFPAHSTPPASAHLDSTASFTIPVMSLPLPRMKNPIS